MRKLTDEQKDLLIQKKNELLGYADANTIQEDEFSASELMQLWGCSKQTKKRLFDKGELTRRMVKYDANKFYVYKFLDV